MLSTAVLLLLMISTANAADDDLEGENREGATGRRSAYNIQRPDGSYRFGYNTDDGQFHVASATPDNTVSGRFGYLDAFGKRIRTQYTAGRRGFRPQGPNVHRKFDLSANYQPGGPKPPKDGSYSPVYDHYSDPREDPSYDFGFDTPTYDRHENSNSKGTVNGHYSYIDDVGIKRVVDYVAGAKTGFHVKGTYPDPPASPGFVPYYFRPVKGSGKGPAAYRGHSAIHRGTDGSYHFNYNTPDQNRHETSDSRGNVKGSYSYVDDKGIKRTIQYEAGPFIGFRVVKHNTAGPYPPYDPHDPSIHHEDYPYLLSHLLPPPPGPYGPGSNKPRPPGPPGLYGSPRKGDLDLGGSGAASESLKSSPTGTSREKHDDDAPEYGSSSAEDYSEEYKSSSEEDTPATSRAHEDRDSSGSSGGSSSEEKGRDNSRSSSADSSEAESRSRYDSREYYDRSDYDDDGYVEPTSVGVAGDTRYTQPEDVWKEPSSSETPRRTNPYSRVRTYGPGGRRIRRPGRAHVQSLDIIPFGTRIPLPGAVVDEYLPGTRKDQFGYSLRSRP